MRKNIAGQKWRVFAFNRTDNTPVTGDAANITAKIAKDWGTATALTDTNPTEVEDGYYLFDISQSESNADNLDLYPESSTANVQVIGTPATFVTVPLEYIRSTLVSSAAQISAGLSGSNVIQYKGDRWSIGFTGLGDVSSRDNEKLWITIKASPQDSDSCALVQIDETNGLTRINKQLAATAANGSITVTDAAAGDLTVVLAASESLKLMPGTYHYDIQYRADTTITTLTIGDFKILPDVSHTVGG